MLEGAMLRHCSPFPSSWLGEPQAQESSQLQVVPSMFVIPGLLLTKEGARGRVFVLPFLLIRPGPLFVTCCP